MLRNDLQLNPTNQQVEIVVFVKLRNSTKRSQTLRSGLFVPEFAPDHTPKQKGDPDKRGPGHPARFALPTAFRQRARPGCSSNSQRSASDAAFSSSIYLASTSADSTVLAASAIWAPARRAPLGSPRHRARLLARAPSAPAARLRPAGRLAAVSALRPAPARHPDHRPWGPPSVSGRQRKSLLPISRREQAIGASQGGEGIPMGPTMRSGERARPFASIRRYRLPLPSLGHGPESKPSQVNLAMGPLENLLLRERCPF